MGSYGKASSLSMPKKRRRLQSNFLFFHNIFQFSLDFDDPLTYCLMRYPIHFGQLCRRDFGIIIAIDQQFLVLVQFTHSTSELVQHYFLFCLRRCICLFIDEDVLAVKFIGSQHMVRDVTVACRPFGYVFFPPRCPTAPLPFAIYDYLLCPLCFFQAALMIAIRAMAM